MAFSVDDYERAVRADASKVLSTINDTAKNVVTCATI
jgi:hypothetical protein